MAIENATPVDTANFDAVLKDFYIGPIRDNLNSKTTWLGRMTRRKVSVSGRRAVMTIRVGRNEGVGSIGENGNMPDPKRQRHRNIDITMSRLYGRVLFNSEVVAASRNADGAFASAVDVEINGVTDDLRIDRNRQCYGDGSGRLAQINAGNADHNVGVARYGVDNPLGFANVGPGTQHLRIGMTVGVFNEVTGAFRGSSEIVGLDADGQTITLDAPIGGALDNEYFYRVSEDTAGVPGALPADSWAYFNEVTGLAGAISDSDLPGPAGTTIDYEGVDATTEPIWQSVIIDNAGVAIPLDLGHLRQAIVAVNQSGDGKVTAFLTNFGQETAYGDMLQGDRRWVNTKTLDGGWEVLTYNGIPIIPDKDMTWGRIYAIDEDTFAIYHEGEVRWIDEDGHILARLPNRDAFQAALRNLWQIGTTARNRSAQITDLTDPMAA